MALFGNSESGKRLPEYRIAALASLDLEEHLRETPFQVERPGHIEWIVTDDDEGNLVARGAIRIPVEMYFTVTDEDKDPEIQRVVVNGRRQFDARIVEDEETDDSYGIDKTALQAQTFGNLRSNIRS